MKMLEVRVWDPAIERPDSVDWIPDHDIDEARLQAYQAGLRFRIVREVPWQEQLARMENNPE